MARPFPEVLPRSAARRSSHTVKTAVCLSSPKRPATPRRVVSFAPSSACAAYAASVQRATTDAADAERTILELLAARDPGKTICPSEAARALGGDDGFRPLMPLVRDAAAALAAAGRIEVTQGGEPVAIDQARGPIRLRAPQRPPDA